VQFPTCHMRPVPAKEVSEAHDRRPAPRQSWASDGRRAHDRFPPPAASRRAIASATWGSSGSSLIGARRTLASAQLQ
jgi:hypothetical protein